jgi:hypothetical protein
MITLEDIQRFDHYSLRLNEFMANLRKADLQEAAARIRQQADKLAELAEGIKEQDAMLSIDLQGIEANIRQVAEGLATAKEEL